MRDIKDYLHLYLGCEAMHGDRKIVVCGLNINSYYIQNILNEDTLRISDIKPILRPLSDMTDYEAIEIYNKQWPNMNDKESWVKALFIKDICCGGYYVEGKVAILDTMMVVKECLSRGFDLFNLIPEGLAIDSTTLKLSNASI
jgi:hypothetical protein